MAKSLAGTPHAWVNLDKKAKAPLTRDQRGKTVELDDTTSENIGSPPLARPIYRPTLIRPSNSQSKDFDDLPGDEQALKPANTAPPAMNQAPAPAKREAPKQDALESLIQEVQ